MRDLTKQPVRTLFLGSDWESVETLKALDEDGRFDIVGVITITDKRVGRKQILTPSKVKEYALENGIEVFHTEKQEERYKQAIDMFIPELIVCKAFGEIIPKFFLEYPKYKSINVHFSILPKYRGAVPIQKAILEGEKDTGITIMLMSEGLDEGDILKIYREKILDSDTNQTLRERLVKKSAEVLGDVLEDWINGKIMAVEQDHDKATYCYQKDISKENAEIKWDTMEPEYIERMVRALLPWPVAWFQVTDTQYQNLVGKRIKLFKVEIDELKDANCLPGEIFVKDKNLYIGTKKNNIFLNLLELQLEGKNIMNEKEFINSLNIT
jgi:methionyl-tRNA formyltransferase